MRLLRRYIFLLAVCIGTLFVVLRFRSNAETESSAAVKSDQNRILILDYTKLWAYHPLNHSEIASHCPKFLNCYFSSDTERHFSEAKAVVFHLPGMGLVKDIPKRAFRGQKFVLYSAEPPKNFFDLLSTDLYTDFFDWAMTYRQDSDVIIPYARLVKRKIPLTEVPELHISERSKPIAWMASNCETESGREKYVTALEKFIDVDIYGECGALRCDKDPESNFVSLSTTQCWKQFARKYYFYLSFENNICNDYCTEKLFFALQYGIVPVVLKRSQCAHIVPKSAVISVEDFKSPKHLVEYLQHLIKNPQKYLKYFEWMKSHEIQRLQYQDDFCALCAKLNENILPIGALKHSDVFHWWISESNCVQNYTDKLINN